MQHLPQTSLGGRLFTDRQHNPNPNHNHQSLKCPRCDSSNTKFCYYNNYNLSQPRHFCKNCRRYWTKGGVLRNVPVGGGCHKSKRSFKPKAKRSGLKGVQQSGSSSESSSTVNVAVSTGSGSVVRVSGANEVQEKSDHNDDNNNTMMLSGEFMNLITNENHQFFDSLSNNSPNLQTTSFSQFLMNNDDWRSGVHQVEKDKIGVSDLTVTIEDLLDNRGACGGVATLDWQHPTADNESQGLFDFTSTVDHQTYWSQATSTVGWSHHSNDQPLFLP